MPVVDLTLELESGPSAPREARTGLAPLVRHLSDECFSDLRVVVSELVANAAQFGPGDRIALQVSVEEEGIVHGHVEDDGDPDQIQVSEGDAVEARGLGLLIVDSIASSWGVDADRGGVWFEIEEVPAVLNGNGNGNGNGHADATTVLAALEGASEGERIGGELLDLHTQFLGVGAEAAEVVVSDDAVVVFLDGFELTPDEEAMVEAPFRAAIERITGRRVVSFASVTKHDPDYVCEIFRLAPDSSSSSA